MKADKRKQPRSLQKLRAAVGGYFWLPCPICSENFGGHEWAGTLQLSAHKGCGVCINCVDEAKRRNALMKTDETDYPIVHVSIGGGRFGL